MRPHCLRGIFVQAFFHHYFSPNCSSVFLIYDCSCIIDQQHHSSLVFAPSSFILSRCETPTLWGLWPLQTPTQCPTEALTEGAPASTTSPTYFRFVFWLHASHGGAQRDSFDFDAPAFHYFPRRTKALITACYSKLGLSLFWRHFLSSPCCWALPVDRKFFWSHSKPWRPFPSFFSPFFRRKSWNPGTFCPHLQPACKQTICHFQKSCQLIWLRYLQGCMPVIITVSHEISCSQHR